MAYSRHFTCDVCGTHKKLMNKWFLVEVTDTSICIRVFDYESAKQERFAILCGENCLQKYLSQKLESLHNQPQPPVSREAAPASKNVRVQAGK